MTALGDKRARRLFVEALPRDGVAAEIGVLNGDFSLLSLEYAKPKEYHMVDRWKVTDSPADSVYNQIQMEKMYRGVKEKFNRFERDDGGIPDVTIHRKFSRDAVTAFSDEYFDWVYIDRNYTYEGIREDLALWWPKVKPGGILAGHDYHEKVPWIKVKKGVDDFLKENDLGLKFISQSPYPDWAVEKP